MPQKLTITISKISNVPNNINSSLIHEFHRYTQSLAIRRKNTYPNYDGAEHPEDSNLKDVDHLAETIRNICNLNANHLLSDNDLSKEQVVDDVELVEKNC